MADETGKSNDNREIVKYEGGKSNEASTAIEAFVHVDSKDSNPTAASSPQIYLIFSSKDAVLLHTLDKEERNNIVHQHPAAIVTACQNAAYRGLVNRRGVFKEDRVVALWRPSFIPFHLEYTIVRDGVTCQHLVSARDKRIKEPAQYAREIMPLAISFLLKPYGSSQAHFPFTWTTLRRGNMDVFDTDNPKAKATIEHGQLIGSRYNDPEAMGIEMAEATAKSINANKLIPGLLELIINPGRNKREPFAEAIELGELQQEKGHPDPPNSKPSTSKATITELVDRTIADAQSSSARHLMKPGKTSTKLTTRSTARKKVKNIHSQGLIEPSHPVYTENKNGKSNNRTSVAAQMPGEQTSPQPSSNSRVLESNEVSKKVKSGKTRPRLKRSSRDPLKKNHCGPDNLPGVQQQLDERALSGGPKHATQDKSPMADEEGTTESGMPLRETFKDEESPVLELPSTEGLECREASLDTKITTTNTYTPPLKSHPEPPLQICPPDAQASAGLLADTQEQDLPRSTPATETSTRLAEAGHLAITLSSLSSPILAPPNAAALQDVALIEDCSTTDYEDADRGASSFCSYDSNETDNKYPPDPALSVIDNQTQRGLSISDPISIPDSNVEGAQGLAWTYAQDIDSDGSLIDAGIRLWEAPHTYYYPHSVPTLLFDHETPARVVVCHGGSGGQEPLIEYDGGTVQIVPHMEPWDDVRSQEGHPDFLTPSKLVEYQACEAAGYHVWRHDRHFMQCRKPGCAVLIMDYDPSSVFCQGCGPKSSVRYCCFRHQIDDITEHWVECGDPSLVLQYVIDHDTAPLHFSDKPPAIIERNGGHGIRSARLQRQKIYVMRNGGYYTLFDPGTRAPRILSWPKTNPRWQELDDRIERLLNIAFLDTYQVAIIRYLYRLLRELLRSSYQWNLASRKLFKAQVRQEFDPGCKGWLDSAIARDDVPCECEWTGESCWTHGQPAIGFKTHVDAMEMQYWILRAWRQQHPIEKDWRVRANGCGLLPLDFGEDLYELGPGWTGWGGLGNNLRGPDWASTMGLREFFLGYEMGLKLGSSC